MELQTRNGTELNYLYERIEQLQRSVTKAVVIDAEKLDMIIAAILAQGHILLEDVPGLGKTMVARALARSLQASFKRIQCTPDLLPSDITGSAIYNQREQQFEFVPGPIFANIVLVDEINRAAPRTQSSLLEAMAEAQVTTDGFTRKLESPFFIIATQNPVEMAGTFPLPEAQLDRFLIRLSLGYPEFSDEVSILEREEHGNPLDLIDAVVSLDDVSKMQQASRAVDVLSSLQEYIVRLVHETRTHPDTILGVSPRGGAALQRCAQAVAFVRQRTYVTPDDIKSAARVVMPHRMMSRDRHSETAAAIIEDVLSRVAVPLG